MIAISPGIPSLFIFSMLSVKIHGWLERTLRSPITLSLTAKTFGAPWGSNWVYTKYVYLSSFGIYFAPNLQV